MAWISLLGAGSFEVVGVMMMNQLHRDHRWQSALLMMGSFCLSFFLLAQAMATLPMATAYAVWTGIGASGGTLAGMLLYGESKDWKRILFIAMVLGAAVGLKLLT